jgi:hypothetical protein
MLHRSALTSYIWVNYGQAPEKFMINHDSSNRFVELAKSSCRTPPQRPAERITDSATHVNDPFREMFEGLKKRTEEN